MLLIHWPLLSTQSFNEANNQSFSQSLSFCAAVTELSLPLCSAVTEPSNLHFCAAVTAPYTHPPYCPALTGPSRLAVLLLVDI